MSRNEIIKTMADCGLFTIVSHGTFVYGRKLFRVLLNSVEISCNRKHEKEIFFTSYHSIDELLNDLIRGV